MTSKIAVITGASSGIGRSIALAFAEEGAELALIGRNINSLQEVAEKCKALGMRAVVYRADLLNETEIKEVKHRALAKSGARCSFTGLNKLAGIGTEFTCPEFCLIRAGLGTF